MSQSGCSFERSFGVALHPGHDTMDRLLLAQCFAHSVSGDISAGRGGEMRDQDGEFTPSLFFKLDLGQLAPVG
jgi:hypothetical protein